MANPDTEILNAGRCRPSPRPAVPIDGGRRPGVAAGASCGRPGERHYGPSGDAGRAESRMSPSMFMNSTLPQKSGADRAYADDPARASLSSAGCFGPMSCDSSPWCGRGRCRAGPVRAAPVECCRYVAFVDPGGSSADAMTLAVAHVDKDGQAILDAVREESRVLAGPRRSGIRRPLEIVPRPQKLSGTATAASSAASRSARPASTTNCPTRPKSDIFRDCLPLLNSGKVELLDHQRLLAELVPHLNVARLVVAVTVLVIPCRVVTTMSSMLLLARSPSWRRIWTRASRRSTPQQ